MVRDHSIFQVQVTLAYDEVLRDELGDTTRTGNRIVRKQVYRIIAREQAYVEDWIAKKMRCSPGLEHTVDWIDRLPIDAAIITMTY